MNPIIRQNMLSFAFVGQSLLLLDVLLCTQLHSLMVGKKMLVLTLSQGSSLALGSSNLGMLTNTILRIAIEPNYWAHLQENPTQILYVLNRFCIMAALISIPLYLRGFWGKKEDLSKFHDAAGLLMMPLVLIELVGGLFLIGFILLIEFGGKWG